MAYGKLAEGDRIWDSATDGDIASADMNELHDQLKGMLGPLEYMVPLCMGQAVVTDDSTANEWAYESTERWAGPSTGKYLYLPIPLREGLELKEVHTVINGNVANTGGTIIVKKKLIGTTTTVSTVANIDTSDAFAVGANTLKSATGLSEVVSNAAGTGARYYVEYKASTAITGTCYVESLYYIAQFGN